MSDYKLMYEEALEQITKLKRMHKEEKLRADLLQKDLDAIDDLAVITQKEVNEFLGGSSER